MWYAFPLVDLLGGGDKGDFPGDHPPVRLGAPGEDRGHMGEAAGGEVAVVPRHVEVEGRQKAGEEDQHSNEHIPAPTTHFASKISLVLQCRYQNKVSNSKLAFICVKEPCSVVVPTISRQLACRRSLQVVSPHLARGLCSCVLLPRHDKGT